VAVGRQRLAGNGGTGRTVNISSHGILFTTQNQLIIGSRIKVYIDWPVQLNDRCNLKLVASGRVVRCEHGKAAMDIEQYEFRTRSALESDTL
jgi:hypothetical protein